MNGLAASDRNVLPLQLGQEARLSRQRNTLSAQPKYRRAARILGDKKRLRLSTFGEAFEVFVAFNEPVDKFLFIAGSFIKFRKFIDESVQLFILLRFAALALCAT
jgi:hypothetical protein